MCEILVKAIDHVSADPVLDRRGAYKRGDPVVIMGDGHEWGNKEGLPKFVLLKIPGVSKVEFVEHIKSWYRRIQYSVIGSNLSIDGHRIKIEATEVHIGTGEGRITRDMVESFLNKWNATVFSTATNEVVFDIAIFDAIKSEGFFGGLDLFDLIFTEIIYTKGTGVHRIEIDYSAKTFENTDERDSFAKALRRNFTLIDNDFATRVITVETDRDTVRGAFQEDVRRKVEVPLVCRKFHLPSSVMDVIMAAGGIYGATQAQYLSYIRNKMVE